MSSKKYHITITENVTERVVHDADCHCVLGVFARDVNDISGIAVVGGISTLEYCTALLSLETTIKNIYKEYPELDMGVSFLKNLGGISMVDLSKLQEMLENLSNPSADDKGGII